MLSSRRPKLAGTCLVLTVLAGCGGAEDEGAGAGAGVLEEGVDESALTRACAAGASTLRGVDVSYYQELIDWDAVKADGVAFAFIRVSDGLANVDSRFARNWSEARRVGLRRGAYQFFRPNLDAIAQADLLLARMGPLQPGDLPPVIDVEASSGLSPSAVARKVEQWLVRVESVTGVRPIIYTGPYFWRDSVGAPSFGARYPLWVAHYGTTCPLVPEPWSRWAFHQRSDAGRVAGISGNCDVNTFAGTLADLDALAFQGRASTPPPAAQPPGARPSGCAPAGAAGRVIEEDDACVELGGPSRTLRAESGGSGGAHVWTGATAEASAENYASWSLAVATSGAYRVEVYVAGGSDGTREARYRVAHAAGADEVYLSQATASGYVELGTFELRAGARHEVRLEDNTGERSGLERRVIFDAVRLTPASSRVCASVGLAAGVASLNVRPRPNTGLDPIDVLAPGQTASRLATVTGLTVDGRSTWYRVRTASGVGYVSGRFAVCR